ncbi:uncharacterized protein At2g39910 isoform X3 [Sorghum bicolor]|uniref:Uncharacterized protein n=1 Tax=Sorghum bicolor TaxID=4558 RepID=A0A194YL66_SORBI|nr:uncharacterized protein At2g39910 isoform X3 [Sorghum bicolor]KXG20729.1 hypothetical protein SORBI_3010G244000 [Sorghum bicolor]|eukprot:XP_021306154.1 uncharacterized protein At2g39910 isoform X3 [Sorghum bicolor]
MPHAAATAAAAVPRAALLTISVPLRDLLAAAPYEPPAGSSASVKALLASLLPSPSRSPPQVQAPAGKEAGDLLLFCAAVLAASPEYPALHWVPAGLVGAAAAAVKEMAAAGGWGSVVEMVVAVAPEVVPPLKAVVKDSCVDADSDEIGAVKPPKEHVAVAAHQFRWLVSQEQGMVGFVHIAKNVKVTELSLYEDAILDACCQNIPADDELWYQVIEVSVLLLTCTQQSNPRSPWYDRMLSEMLGHLERQPLNKERRVAWLTLIGPVFDAMGLFLLAHFRRLFSLFFQWMHTDDDKTVLLTLKQIHAIVKLTWIRKSPYTSRLVDELVLLYKESATRSNREVMREHILEILVLLQNCKGQQFEEAWKKHELDPDLTMLMSTFSDLCIKNSSP